MLTHALSLHFLFPTRCSTCCNLALLLKLLAAHFAALSLVKPVTSRPASGERFLVCRGFAGDGDGDGNAALPAVVAHLLAANRACAEAEEAEEAAEAAAAGAAEGAAAGARGGGGGGEEEERATAGTAGTTTAALYSLVALEALAADAELCAFLRASNDALARAQLRACEAIAEEAAGGKEGTRRKGGAAQEGGDAAGTRRASVHCPSYWRLWGLEAR